MKHNDNTTDNRITDAIAARFRKQGRVRTAPPGREHPPAQSQWYKRALLYGLLLTEVMIIGAQLLPSRTPERGLTTGEAGLAQAIFGADFNTDSVRLRFENNQPDDSEKVTRFAYTRTTDPDSINIVHQFTNADDYSQTTGLDARGGTFIHELTHLWQTRNHIVSPACVVSEDPLVKYNYTLTPQSRFEDFCDEQQAAIVQNYAQRFIIPGQSQMQAEAAITASARSAGVAISFPLSREDELLRSVVERAFPHAAQARLRMQDNYNRAASCIADGLRANPSVAPHAQEAACNSKYLRTAAGEPLRDPFADIPTPQPPAPAATPQVASAQAPKTPRL